MCVFLALSIAMKADHYDTLLSSKVAQLDEIFAAKLGWLVGNQYSRIATPDIDEREPATARDFKRSVIEEALDSALWVSPKQFAALRDRVKAWEREAGESVNSETLGDLADQLPSQMALLAERIVKSLQSNGVFDETPENLTDRVQKARLLIANDAAAKSIAKGIR